MAEVKPHDDIPVTPIGKSFLISLPSRLDMGSLPTERGESSSGPSLQSAQKVLKSVLSSWIETLSFRHLEAGFGMIKHGHLKLSLPQTCCRCEIEHCRHDHLPSSPSHFVFTCLHEGQSLSPAVLSSVRASRGKISLPFLRFNLGNPFCSQTSIFKPFHEDFPCL